jgi:carboxypeptidase family protein/TonB-dependent receptor-like protein
MRFVRVLAVSVLLSAAASGAEAQRTTGAIFGTVVDASGAMLPGVTVTIDSTAVFGKPTTVTTETGVFRFPDLAPGTYTVTFAIAGFSTLERQGILVSVGSTVELNVAMSVSQLQETISVQGDSPNINTSTAEVHTTFGREWVANAPVQRNSLYDFINTAPGVSAANTSSDRSTAFGSATNENVYQLDGNELTAPNTGAPWTQLNVDTIQEVEVLSLGAPAEFGNMAGAVFNLVGRQGGNQFHGDVNYFFQHDKLTSRNTTDEEDTGKPYHRDKYNDVTFQLGGPIVRDKVGFFGSYQYRLDRSSQPGTDKNFPTRVDVHRVYGKVHWQISSAHKLVSSVANEWYSSGGGGSALQDPSTVADEHGVDPAPNVTWTSILGKKTFIEARYTGFYVSDHLDPLLAGEPRIKPQFFDLISGRVTGGIGLWYDLSIRRTGGSVKVTRYAERFAGSHELRFGAQIADGGSTITAGYNDVVYTLGAEPYYGLTRDPYLTGGYNRSLGFYADDTWRAGSRLTLTLGVRADRNRAYFPEFDVLDRSGRPTGQTTGSVDDLFTWTSVSPRVGFNLKLDNQGRTVLMGHYGRYYRGLITLEFAGVSSSVSPLFLFSGLYDSAGNPLDKSLLSDNRNLRVDPDYKNPYTDQLIVGAAFEVFKHVGISAQYVYKNGDRASGYIDATGRYQTTTYVDSVGTDATNQPIEVFRLVSPPGDRVFTLTNPDGMNTSYNGFNIQATRRLANHWQLGASLTLSDSEGRLGSSRNGPAAAQASLAGTFGRNPNDFVNTDGLLIGDRPVLFKVQGLVELPYGITTAASFQHQTGRPWGRRERVTGLGVPVTIRMEEVDGSRRVSDWNFLDVRIQKDFRITGARVGGFLDILNATNSGAYQSIESDLGSSTAFGKPTFFINPRTVMLGAKVQF